MTKRELIDELRSFGDEGEVFLLIDGKLRSIEVITPAADYMTGGPDMKNLDDAALLPVLEGD